MFKDNIHSISYYTYFIWHFSFWSCIYVIFSVVLVKNNTTRVMSCVSNSSVLQGATELPLEDDSFCSNLLQHNCVCVRERVCGERECVSECVCSGVVWESCICGVWERESVCEREWVTCVWEKVYVGECVCVCVWERERERERVCVCVYVVYEDTHLYNDQGMTVITRWRWFMRTFSVFQNIYKSYRVSFLGDVSCEG